MAANKITIEKPASTASNAARAALITETQPLTPHAQGRFFSSLPASARKPSGKGMPIKKAGRATTGNEIINLMRSEEPATRFNKEERKKV